MRGRCCSTRVLVHFAGRDDVDGNAFVFGDGANVVGRHHTGVVGTVREHDDHFAARDFGGVAQGEQQPVVERGIVAGDGLAQTEDGFVAVVGQQRRTRQIAAKSVDRHRIGSIKTAHEIGDRVGGVDESAIHIVAGVEQHENVGADKGVGS